MSSPNDTPQSNLPPFANQLVQAGYITLPQLQQAIILKRKNNRPLIEILPMVTGHPLPPDLLHQYRQEQLLQLKATYKVEYLDPETESIDWPSIENLFSTFLPFEICRRYQILPLHKQESAARILTLAMVNPNNQEVLDDLRRILRDKELQFERRAILRLDYHELVEIYLKRKQEAASPNRSLQEQDLETLVDITDIFEDPEASPRLGREEGDEDLGLIHQANQGPVVTLVNNILVCAIENKASEIHLEPQENQLNIRFRQDGVMRLGFEPISRNATPAILSRLKILANLDVGQKLQPQKGQMTKTFSGRKIDFRVHTLPSQHGEKIVLRVFDSRSALWPLDELITIESTRNLVRSMIERPSGLILLTAPIGGGGSTSFYSLLAHRNQSGVNISTAENSIERTLNGVTQVEIDSTKGIEYPSILQSFRGQDVDIIGIDQLKDSQIAISAIESALRGHLVVSSLPINDAFSAITRLNKLADQNSVADTLIGVINQRLVRRVCPVCRLKHTPNPAELAKLGLSAHKIKQSSFYKANSFNPEEIIQAREKGRLCRHCNGVGYQGQIGVFEVINITPNLKTLIAGNVDAATLKQTAWQEGAKSLLAYGLELVCQGHTTLEEIERVIADGLTLESPPSPPKSATSPQVIARIQELESLLQAISREFQGLKREMGLVSPPLVSPSVIHEKLPESPPWETPKPNLEADKETIVSHASIYEELTDPGDWEQLKREIDLDKETIVSLDSSEDDPSSWNVNPSFRSIPDPWSSS